MQQKTFTLQELAAYTHSKLVGLPSYKIDGVADLESATSSEVSFLANTRYEGAMRRSKAGVIFISTNYPPIEGRNFLLNENPSLAFQKTVEAFYGSSLGQSGFNGIHPTAVVHESSKIGKNVTIGPHAVIDQGVTIGDSTTISANCFIGAETSIGTDCLLHPHVTVRERCKIGNRVILQPGAVIGGCGYGYITNEKGQHIKLTQVGIVVIEDDVEIGSNTTVDRARFKATTVKRGTKIDNLVQIAHGVSVGENNLIVAQTGIAGSSSTGRNVVIGGQSAVAGHIKLGDQVMIAACSGVSKTLTRPGPYGGVPAVPLNEYNRNSVYLRNIETYIDEIKKLREELDALRLSRNTDEHR